MMKKAIAIATIIGAVFTINAEAHNAVNRTARDLPIYETIAEEFDNEIALPERVFDTDELTAEILENRVGCGYVIVEKLIGVCENNERDGVVINTKDKQHNYISYRYAFDYCTGKKVEKGDVILTYLIYNPKTAWVDDIIERVDYIIDEKTFN